MTAYCVFLKGVLLTTFESERSLRRAAVSVRERDEALLWDR